MDNGGIWPGDESYFQNIRETALQDTIEQLTKELVEARADLRLAKNIIETHVERVAERDKLIEQMRDALQWYKEQVSSCNRNGDAGELARDRLAKDVGKRAEAALSAAERINK